MNAARTRIALGVFACIAFTGCVTLPATTSGTSSIGPVMSCEVDAMKLCEAALGRGAASGALNASPEEITLQIPAGGTVEARCFIQPMSGLIVSAQNMAGPPLSPSDATYLRKRGICATGE